MELMDLTEMELKDWTENIKLTEMKLTELTKLTEINKTN